MYKIIDATLAVLIIPLTVLTVMNGASIYLILLLIALLLLSAAQGFRSLREKGETFRPVVLFLAANVFGIGAYAIYDLIYLF
ncbi:hypothetical protein ACQCVE_19125 [Metabacillus sp. 113a]|uniref:hypothetical protein n=1 Tax=Metabacillus sp. 113a TaxID=3404706 RepID=UPI003CF674EE